LHIAALATINGRAMTTDGNLTTDTSTIDGTSIPGDCATLDVPSIDEATKAIIFYPNPFGTSVTIAINEISKMNTYEIRIYNLLGEVVMNKFITQQTTTLETNKFPSGIYFYQVVSNNQLIQSGKLIALN
jgi:hypothetical protein